MLVLYLYRRIVCTVLCLLYNESASPCLYSYCGYTIAQCVPCLHLLYSGCMARVNTGACLLHSACVRAVRCSAWIVRAVVYLACVCVCVRPSACAARLVPFVQHFVCQRGQMCLLCPTPCAVRLGSTGNVPTCPCWYSCWYPFVQCFAWLARVMYLFARGRTRTGTPCTVLRLVSTGNEPVCPCSYLCCV